MEWISIEDRKPQPKDVLDTRFINCVVYSCHPNNKRTGEGTINVCRWDVENDCWLESDIKHNFFLQPPYVITHFNDKIEHPTFNDAPIINEWQKVFGNL